MPSSFPAAAEHLLLSTADGFRCKTLCFSYLRLENSKEELLLAWIGLLPILVYVIGHTHETYIIKTEEGVFPQKKVILSRTEESDHGKDK